jgi:hypothetical protein
MQQPPRTPTHRKKIIKRFIKPSHSEHVAELRYTPPIFTAYAENFRKGGAEDPLLALQPDLSYTVTVYVPQIQPKLRKLCIILEASTGIPIIFRAKDGILARYVVTCSFDPST